MAQINVGGYVTDTKTIDYLLETLKKIPEDKREAFLDALKDQKLYSDNRRV